MSSISGLAPFPPADPSGRGRAADYLAGRIYRGPALWPSTADPSRGTAGVGSRARTQTKRPSRATDHHRRRYVTHTEIT